MGWPSISSQSHIETTGYFFEVLLRTPYNKFFIWKLGKGAPLAYDAYEEVENSEDATCFYFNHCINMDAEYIFITSMHSGS